MPYVLAVLVLPACTRFRRCLLMQLLPAGVVVACCLCWLPKVPFVARTRCVNAPCHVVVAKHSKNSLHTTCCCCPRHLAIFLAAQVVACTLACVPLLSVPRVQGVDIANTAAQGPFKCAFVCWYTIIPRTRSMPLASCKPVTELPVRTALPGWPLPLKPAPPSPHTHLVSACMCW